MGDRGPVGRRPLRAAREATQLGSATVRARLRYWTLNWKFVHHNSGFEELYDVASDPAELRNVAGKVG